MTPHATAHTAPNTAPHPVLGVPPATPGAAAAYFAASLAFHTDVSDVAAALAADGDPGFTLVDTRSDESWAQVRIPGAVHLPGAHIAERAARLLDPARPVVVHCWGPACNGATRAALALATLGYQVKEMLGGIEYWVREGLPHESDAHAGTDPGAGTSAGPLRRAPDPLTAPVAAASCGC